MSTISVVIPTYRRPAAVHALLRSLFASTRLPDEVVVVDNDPDGSFNPTGQAVAWRVRVVSAGLGLNLAGARNRGWRATRSDLCLFIDDDNVVAPDALGALSRAAATSGCGLVAPVIYDGRNPSTVWCGGVRRSWWTTRTRFMLRGQDVLPDASVWETEDMPNSIAIPLTVLEAVGGFDEVNFPFHYDEGDIAQRIRQRGLTILVIRDAAVWHSGGTDTNPGIEMFRGLDLGGRQRVEAMAYSRVYYHRLYSPMLQRVVALGFFVPVWFVVVAIACLQLPRSPHEKREILASLVRGLLRGYTRTKR